MWRGEEGKCTYVCVDTGVKRKEGGLEIKEEKLKAYEMYAAHVLPI